MKNCWYCEGVDQVGSALSDNGVCWSCEFEMWLACARDYGHDQRAGRSAQWVISVNPGQGWTCRSCGWSEEQEQMPTFCPGCVIEAGWERHVMREWEETSR